MTFTMNTSEMSSRKFRHFLDFDGLTLFAMGAAAYMVLVAALIAAS